jgi:hypothetical protein
MRQTEAESVPAEPETWNSVAAGLVALPVVGSVLARLRRRFV